MPKPKAKYRWSDVGEKEIFEVNTERMQYTHSSQGAFLASFGKGAGTPEKPWRVEVKSEDKWVFVGCWPTALTARVAAIEHYERFTGAPQ